MKILLLIVSLLMVGCTTFTGQVTDMREQAEMCVGEVTFSVVAYNGREKIAYKCHWENIEEML